jgi:hypothetical protein
MENSKVIQESKALIRTYLDEYCSTVTSPYVCGLVSTKKGYEQVEQFVLQRMARNGDTVAEAIMLKERILDPNRLVD